MFSSYKSIFHAGQKQKQEGFWTFQKKNEVFTVNTCWFIHLLSGPELLKTYAFWLAVNSSSLHWETWDCENYGFWHFWSFSFIQIQSSFLQLQHFEHELENSHDSLHVHNCVNRFMRLYNKRWVICIVLLWSGSVIWVYPVGYIWNTHWIIYFQM